MSILRSVLVGGLALGVARRLLVRRLDLRGRVVLITGSSRGLGLLLARAFAREGCRLVMCARDEAELERARADVAALGADVLAERCDVRRKSDVERLVQAAIERFGRIDVLVNNAGVIEVAPLDSLTEEDFSHAMSSNYAGALHTIFAVLPGMRARRSGSIVNITSIGGKVAVPHLLPYDAAKFALVGLSEGLRAELSPAGIWVTTVIPGLMRTGSALHARFGGSATREFGLFVASATLPLSAMNADRAARRILDAVRRRAPQVVLGWQAKLLRIIHDLAPGLTARALGLVARLLPHGDGGPARPVEGRVLFELDRPVLVGSLLCKDATHANEI